MFLLVQGWARSRKNSPKEKYAPDFKNIFGFAFSLLSADETPAAFTKKFGWERPGEQFGAAKPHKHRVRSRPNRGFRPRSFCRANFRSVFFGGALSRRLGGRNAYV
jgi:hypothetical protein